MLTKLALFAVMLELHIIVDFHMQGILAKLKQESEWLNHPEYNEMYKNDWAIAMWLHAFEWTFVVMLPLAYLHHWEITSAFAICFVVNMVVHAATDHLKANMRDISLVADQTIHILQILAMIYFLG